MGDNDCLLNELLESTKTLENSAINVLREFEKNYKVVDKLCKEHESIARSLKGIKGTTKSSTTKLNQIQTSLKRVDDLIIPKTGSLFTRFMLGKVNVKQYRMTEKRKLKQEYQKFKTRTDYFWILATLLQFFFFQNRLLQMIYQIWLVYYYLTLALRENILKVNGSTIKLWWIIHHYISIIICLIIVTWSDGETYRYFFNHFLYLSIAQGIVQVLQNRYQRGRLYALIATGKAHVLDVEGGEHGWYEKGWLTPTLMALFPFLLFLQIFQVWEGFQLLKETYVQRLPFCWQTGVLGILFLLTGSVNLVVTIYTYNQKGWRNILWPILGGKKKKEKKEKKEGRVNGKKMD